LTTLHIFVVMMSHLTFCNNWGSCITQGLSSTASLAVLPSVKLHVLAFASCLQEQEV